MFPPKKMFHTAGDTGIKTNRKKYIIYIIRTFE